jgi:uncharacterized tellurite resistance protein B-like protein
MLKAIPRAKTTRRRRDLDGLTRSERVRLLKFVCAAAWADLDVSSPERSFVQALALRLGLSDQEMRQVERWLEKPPPPEEVDPALVPREHRRLFLDAVRDLVTADGVVDGPEAASLRLLEELLG